MVIMPGSSQGAMLLYADMMQRFDVLGAAAGQTEVNTALTSLCPPGWAFREQNGQWGLWPDDVLKYHSHALLYLQWATKMVEVERGVHD